MDDVCICDNLHSLFFIVKDNEYFKLAYFEYDNEIEVLQSWFDKMNIDIYIKNTEYNVDDYEMDELKITFKNTYNIDYLQNHTDLNSTKQTDENFVQKPIVYDLMKHIQDTIKYANLKREINKTKKQVLDMKYCNKTINIKTDESNETEPPPRTYCGIVQKKKIILFQMKL